MGRAAKAGAGHRAGRRRGDDAGTVRRIGVVQRNRLSRVRIARRTAGTSVGPRGRHVSCLSAISGCAGHERGRFGRCACRGGARARDLRHPAQRRRPDPVGASLEELLTPKLDADGRQQLLQLQRDLNKLIVELAGALWNRRDRAALTTVRYCVVDLPSALLLKGKEVTDPLAMHTLAQAVRGIAAQPPPTTSGLRSARSTILGS